MTLDQLRAELERGPMTPAGEHRVDVQQTNRPLAHRLHALALRRAAGVRLKLPVTNMPVLP